MMEFLMLLFIVLGFALWIWALMDISKRGFRHWAQKWIWMALILALPFLGPILYFQVKRKVSKTNYRIYGGNYFDKRIRTNLQS